MLMLLLDPLKQFVLIIKPIKWRTWDKLPLTTESHFKLLNSMRPFNECWLQPLRHSSLSVYVYLFTFYSFPVQYPVFPISASMSRTSLLSPSVSQAVSFSRSRSPSLPFTWTQSPCPQPPFIPLAHACRSPQQSPWHLVRFTVKLPDY